MPSVQAAFRDARQKAGIKKEATIHTLRHCYATHLLENRVDTRIIQGVLGHKCPRSTNIYTHLTSKTDIILNDAVSQLMSNKYKASKTGIWKRMTLEAFEFIRRFLQHVLPRGFHKVRYYGFLAPKHKQRFNSLKLMLENSSGKTAANYETTKPVDYLRKCPKCKTGYMVVILHIFHKKIQFFL